MIVLHSNPRYARAKAAFDTEWAARIGGARQVIEPTAPAVLGDGRGIATGLRVADTARVLVWAILPDGQFSSCTLRDTGGREVDFAAVAGLLSEAEERAPAIDVSRTAVIAACSALKTFRRAHE